MLTPLDYARYGLSQDRFDNQQDQFGENMDFRRETDARNFGFRQQQYDDQQAHRQQQMAAAAQQRQMAALRFLPKPMQYRQAQQFLTPQGGDSMMEHNNAALPSIRAEIDRTQNAPGMAQQIPYGQMAAQQRMSPQGPRYSRMNGETYINGQRYMEPGIEGGAPRDVSNELGLARFEQMKNEMAQGPQGPQDPMQAMMQREMQQKEQSSRQMAATQRINAQNAYWGFPVGKGAYDDKGELMQLPSSTDQYGNVTPGRSVAFPRSVYQSIQDDLGAISGMDDDPETVRMNGVQQKLQRQQQILQNSGVSPERFEEVSRLAASMAGGRDPDEATLIRAAQTLQALQAPQQALNAGFAAGERDFNRTVSQQRAGFNPMRAMIQTQQQQPLQIFPRF